MLITKTIKRVLYGIYRKNYNWKKHWDDISTTNDVSIASGRAKLDMSILNNIASDISKKMNLTSDDVLLDVGCNQGDLTMKLSEYVANVMGIDISYKAIELANNKHPDIEFYETTLDDFMSKGYEQSFSSVVTYSVSHYMNDINMLSNFINGLVSGCRSKGRILIGDVPLKELENNYGEYNFRWLVLTKKQWQSILGVNDRVKEVVFLDQDGELYWQHYRKDILIKLL